MSSRATPQPFDALIATDIAARFASLPGGLLPALWETQVTFGHVPREAIAILAKAFNLTEAETYGVASFYHDFRLDGPSGRHVLKLCRAEACQAVGADALAAYVRKKLKVEWGGTTPDGEWTLEPVFCLGLCAIGPSATVDGEVHAHLDKASIDALVPR
jgi:formate dehydrogenase subunit gamma